MAAASGGESKIWEGSDNSRIPAQVYSDPDVYARELERIFYGPHWSYVDDSEVIECSQQSLEQDGQFATLCELGGTGTENTDHMVTETLIRGMYRYWREVMDI